MTIYFPFLVCIKNGEDILDIITQWLLIYSLRRALLLYKSRSGKMWGFFNDADLLLAVPNYRVLFLWLPVTNGGLPFCVVLNARTGSEFGLRAVRRQRSTVTYPLWFLHDFSWSWFKDWFSRKYLFYPVEKVDDLRFLFFSYFLFGYLLFVDLLYLLFTPFNSILQR